jgi:hypothetical protein
MDKEKNSERNRKYKGEGIIYRSGKNTYCRNIENGVRI